MVTSNNKDEDMIKVDKLEPQGNLHVFLTVTVFVAAVAICAAAFIQVGNWKGLDPEKQQAGNLYNQLNKKIHETTMNKEPKLETVHSQHSAQPPPDGKDQVFQQQPTKEQPMVTPPKQNQAHTTQPPQPQQKQKPAASRPVQQQRTTQQDKPADHVMPQPKPAANHFTAESETVLVQQRTESTQQLKPDAQPIVEQKTVTSVQKPPQAQPLPKQKPTSSEQQHQDASTPVGKPQKPATPVKQQQKSASPVEQQQKPTIPAQPTASSTVQVQQPVQQRKKQIQQTKHIGQQKPSTDKLVLEEKIQLPPTQHVKHAVTPQVQKPMAHQQPIRKEPSPQQRQHAKQTVQRHSNPPAQSAQQQNSQQQKPIIQSTQAPQPNVVATPVPTA